MPAKLRSCGGYLDPLGGVQETSSTSDIIHWGKGGVLEVNMFVSLVGGGVKWTRESARPHVKLKETLGHFGAEERKFSAQRRKN